MDTATIAEALQIPAAVSGWLWLSAFADQRQAPEPAIECTALDRRRRLRG
jgi:hypothetical protein